MAWIFLEALLALGIGVAIVWWTMSARRPDRDHEGGKAPRDTDGGER
jgi:hypothetical protein